MLKKPPELRQSLDHRAIDNQVLLGELRKLRRELLKIAQRPSVKDQDATDLVLFRFCEKQSFPARQALSDSLELTGWQIMPVDGDLYPSLRLIQRTIDRLAHAAGHDDLTGLARRDMFEHALMAEMERARRTKSSVSLAILDIDDFKKINDICGHVQGDDVLRRFSALLKEQTREIDLCARLGGEEFALIMPATSLIRAELLLQRLLEAARGIRFPCAGSPREMGITCSVGLACYKGLGELSFNDFVEMADKALYQAKDQGKDRIFKAPFKDIAPAFSEDSLVEPAEKHFLYNLQPEDEAATS